MSEQQVKVVKARSVESFFSLGYADGKDANKVYGASVTFSEMNPEQKNAYMSGTSKAWSETGRVEAVE